MDEIFEAIFDVVFDGFSRSSSSGSKKNTGRNTTGKYLKASRVKEGHYVNLKGSPFFDLHDDSQPRRLKVVYASTVKAEKGTMLLIVELRNGVRANVVLPAKHKVKTFKNLYV